MPIKPIDQSSPEYKRGVITVVLLVGFLGLVGGTFLGVKISRAERLASERAQENQSSAVQPEQAEEQPEPAVNKEENKRGKTGEPVNGLW